MSEESVHGGRFGGGNREVQRGLQPSRRGARDGADDRRLRLREHGPATGWGAVRGWARRARVLAAVLQLDALGPVRDRGALYGRRPRGGPLGVPLGRGGRPRSCPRCGRVPATRGQGGREALLRERLKGGPEMGGETKTEAAVQEFDEARDAFREKM